VLLSKQFPISLFALQFVSGFWRTRRLRSRLDCHFARSAFGCRSGCWSDICNSNEVQVIQLLPVIHDDSTRQAMACQALQLLTELEPNRAIMMTIMIGRPAA
jgi:hypothetical protein